MYVCEISDGTLQRIQLEENAFYWSRCCENLLRKHGIIPWGKSNINKDEGLKIYPRLFSDRINPGGALVEGPIAEITSNSLGLVCENRITDKLVIFRENKQKFFTFQYPKFRIFAKDPQNWRARRTL